MVRPAIERFFEKVKFTSGCWEWTGTRHRYGYGMFSLNRKSTESMTTAHRALFKISNTPIPKGMVIDHICKNPPCVRPSHLRVVTQRQNYIDYSDSIAAKNSRKKFCKRGHPFNKSNTYRLLLKNGNYQRQCKICWVEDKRLLKKKRTKHG